MLAKVRILLNERVSYFDRVFGIQKHTDRYWLNGQICSEFLTYFVSTTFTTALKTFCDSLAFLAQVMNREKSTEGVNDDQDIEPAIRGERLVRIPIDEIQAVPERPQT
jgi:hypothetical protein